MEIEIRAKRKRINILEKDTKSIREELQGALYCLDLSYICSLFLVANDKSILHHDNIQKRKLKNILEIWLKEVINDKHDANNMIFNFSSYKLMTLKRAHFVKSLIFQLNLS